MSNFDPAVVVGIDGSPSSIEALEFAAAMADRRKAPLSLVNVHQNPADELGLPMPAEFSGWAQDDEMEETLQAMVERIHTEYPHMSIRARQVGGPTATVLIELSRRALATVVGRRGSGGFSELLLGSVSAQVSAHASGPVIVVRPPIPDDTILPGPEERRWRKPLGPVLALTDGSEGAGLALRFAAQEAVSRGVQLVIAHVYDGSDEDAEKLLFAAADSVESIYSGPAIELRPIYSKNLPEALVEASRRAALTVAGSRGRGGFAGMVLGSISRTLTHHAYGPVAVVHPPAIEVL